MHIEKVKKTHLFAEVQDITWLALASADKGSLGERIHHLAKGILVKLCLLHYTRLDASEMSLACTRTPGKYISIDNVVGKHSPHTCMQWCVFRLRRTRECIVRFTE